MAARRPAPPFLRRGPKGGRGRPAAAKTPRGSMNRSEENYAINVLEPERHEGKSLWWGSEPIRLRLAHDCIFTPDFGVLQADGVFRLEDF